MDPNETLRKLREHAQEVIQSAGLDALGFDEKARNLASHFYALDTWLSRGGFAPEAWRGGPDAPVSIRRWGEWRMATETEVHDYLNAYKPDVPTEYRETDEGLEVRTQHV